MDKTRAQYLRGIALREQHKAFIHWTSLPTNVDERQVEQARQECSEWALAANELDQEVHKQEQAVS